MAINPIQDKNELTELILGRRGGETTLKIIDNILVKPMNINQLARELGMDYNTIRYHMDKINEHDYVRKGDQKYGRLYYVSPKLKKCLKDLEQIKKHLKNQKK